jgi:Ca2+ transporting ATPase
LQAQGKGLTLEFSRDRKSMGVFATSTSNEQKIFVKGAPEKVLERCKFIRTSNGETVALDDETRRKIDASLHDLSGGKFVYRCLGLATVDKPKSYKEVVDGVSKGVNSVEFEVRFSHMAILSLTVPSKT